MSPTPHDAVFKAFLTVPETARTFLDIHLPESLKSLCDLSTLTLESGSFLDNDLRAYFSDVLYSVRTKDGVGYIHITVEHQSSYDPHIAFRQLRYAIAAMQRHLDAGHKTLPLVIPIHFYHGKETPFPGTMNWLELFDSPAIAQSIYTQAFPLVDLTVTPDNEILKHKQLALLELVQKHIRQRDLLDYVDTLATLLIEHTLTDTQLSSLMEYLILVGKTSNLKVLMETLAQRVPEHEEEFMRIAEQLEARGEARGRQLGREEGREEGLEQGRAEQTQHFALKLLKSGMERNFVIEMTGLSSDELDIIQKELKTRH
ncbi:Rpn family recombination-promoting nuclease/putative transposase [Vibrio mediterranei]